jgi:pimeloyl-ACP methyl ester carboxylesterase
MSTTGNPDLPRLQPDGQAATVTPRPADWYTDMEYQVGALKILAGDGFPFDEDWIRKVLVQAFDRCLYPQGTDRHTIAILAQNNRKADLASVKVPTLVIHGTDDPLVPVEGGKDTAASIPGAKLLLIEGMGHGLPRGAWPRIVEAITELTKRV